MSRVPRSMFAAAVLSAASLSAQSPTPTQSRVTASRTGAIPLVTESAAPRALADETVRRLNWRSVGPANNAGRISVVVGVPGDPYTYYVAGANGGIIKTTNAGTTFKPIFDKQDVSSIGAIAIAASARSPRPIRERRGRRRFR